MFLCKRGWLEVGVDAVWVGGGQLGEGLFPVGGGLALDEAGLGPALAGGFASVSFAFSRARLSSMLQIASHSSFTAAVSLGKCPRFLETLRSWYG